MKENIKYTPEQVFGAAKIEEWKREGHWPPPPGMTVLPEIRPDPKEVKKLMVALKGLLPTSQRGIIQDAIDRYF